MVLLLDTDSTLDVLYPLVALYALTVATKSVSVRDCSRETSPVSQLLMRRGGFPEFQRSWTIRRDYFYVLTRTLRFPSSVFRYVDFFGSHDDSR